MHFLSYKYLESKYEASRVLKTRYIYILYTATAEAQRTATAEELKLSRSVKIDTCNGYVNLYILDIV